MSKRRLSRIQHDVLHVLLNHQKEWLFYGEIKWAIALKHERITTEPTALAKKIAERDGKVVRKSKQRIAESFLASFSRSLSSLESKYFVETKRVNVMFELELLQFLEFWTYYGNATQDLQTRREIAGSVSTPDQIAKMAKVPIFFEHVNRIHKNYHKMYRLTSDGRREMEGRMGS